MYNKSYQNHIQMHTAVNINQPGVIKRQPFSYRNLDYIDSITWNIHLFWRLLGSKKTRHGASLKIKQVFLKLVNYYVYFGFFFSNSKYVKSSDVLNLHRRLHSNRFSVSSDWLDHLFSLSQKILYSTSFGFDKNISFPVAKPIFSFLNGSSVVQTWWTQACAYQREWSKNKVIFLYYKKKYLCSDSWYASNAMMVDTKWCIDGQQLIHFYTYFYFLWQDFIQNVCYFVYPNMHVFGKKYKVQRRWAVLKIRNYYGQYKWFLFYIGQFINVDFRLLDYFKRGVVQWTKYASFPQKWFFILNTLVSFRWYQMEAVRNDSLKRNRFLWKENLFSCLDSCSSIWPSLSVTHKASHSIRSYLSWESDKLWQTGDIKALLGIWKTCVSFREKLFQLRGTYWSHTKVFAQFRFRGSSSSRLVGKLKAKKLFYSKKLPSYSLGVQKAMPGAASSRFKWKKDIFWNLKSRVILKKRLFDFIKRIRYNREDLKQVVYSYFCNHYVRFRDLNQVFLIHKSVLLRSYQQKQLTMNKVNVLPLSLSFGKRGHWVSKLLTSGFNFSSARSLKPIILGKLVSRSNSAIKWNVFFNMLLAGWCPEGFIGSSVENSSIVSTFFMNNQLLKTFKIKKWFVSSVYISLLKRLCTWSLRTKKKAFDHSLYNNEGFKLIQKGYHDGWIWVVLCVWLWRYVIILLSKKVARKMISRLWNRFTLIKNLSVLKGIKKTQTWKIRSFLKRHVFFYILGSSFRRYNGSTKRSLLFQHFCKATKWIWTLAKSRLMFKSKGQFQSPFFRIKGNHFKQYEIKRISLSVDFFSKKLFLYNRFLRRKFKNKKSKKKIKKWMWFRKKVRSRLKYTYGLRSYNTEYESTFLKFNFFIVSLFKWFNNLYTVYSYRNTIQRLSRLYCSYYLFNFLGSCQVFLDAAYQTRVSHPLFISSYLYHTNYNQKDIIASTFHGGKRGYKLNYSFLNRMIQPLVWCSSYFSSKKSLSLLTKWYPANLSMKSSIWVQANSNQKVSLRQKYFYFIDFFFGLCKTFGHYGYISSSKKGFLHDRGKEYSSILDGYPDVQYAKNIKFFQKWKSVSNQFKKLLPEHPRDTKLLVDSSLECSNSFRTLGYHQLSNLYHGKTISQRLKWKFIQSSSNDKFWRWSLNKWIYQEISTSFDSLSYFYILGSSFRRYISYKGGLYNHYLSLYKYLYIQNSFGNTCFSYKKKTNDKSIFRRIFTRLCMLFYSVKYKLCLFLGTYLTFNVVATKFRRKYDGQLDHYKLSISMSFDDTCRSIKLFAAPWSYLELCRISLFYKTFLVLVKYLHNFLWTFFKSSLTKFIKYFLGSFFASTLQLIDHWNNTIAHENILSIKSDHTFSQSFRAKKFLSSYNQLNRSAIFVSNHKKWFYNKYKKAYFNKWKVGEHLFSRNFLSLSHTLFSSFHKGNKKGPIGPANSFDLPVFFCKLRKSCIQNYIKRSFKFWRNRYVAPGFRRQKLRNRYLYRYKHLFFQPFIWGISSFKSGLKKFKYKKRKLRHRKKRTIKVNLGFLKVYRSHPVAISKMLRTFSIKSLFFDVKYGGHYRHLRKKLFFILRNLHSYLQSLLSQKYNKSQDSLQVEKQFSLSEHKYLFLWQSWFTSFCNDSVTFICQKGQAFNSNSFFKTENKFFRLLSIRKKSVSILRRQCIKPFYYFQEEADQSKISIYNHLAVQKQKILLFCPLVKWFFFLSKKIRLRYLIGSLLSKKETHNTGLFNHSFVEQLGLSKQIFVSKLVPVKSRSLKLYSQSQEYYTLIHRSIFNLTLSNYVWLNWRYASVYLYDKCSFSKEHSLLLYHFKTFIFSLHSQGVDSSFLKKKITKACGPLGTKFGESLDTCQYIWNLKDYFSTLFQFLYRLREILQVRTTSLVYFKSIRSFLFSHSFKTCYSFLKAFLSQLKKKDDNLLFIRVGWSFIVYIYCILFSLYDKFFSSKASNFSYTSSLFKSLNDSKSNIQIRGNIQQGNILIQKCFKTNYMYFMADSLKSVYGNWISVLSEIKKIVISHAVFKTSVVQLENWSSLSKYYFVFLYIFFTFFGQGLFFMLKWFQGWSSMPFVVTSIFPLFKKYIFFLGKVENLKWHKVFISFSYDFNIFDSLVGCGSIRKNSLLEEAFRQSQIKRFWPDLMSISNQIGVYGLLLSVYLSKMYVYVQNKEKNDSYWPARSFLCFYASFFIPKYLRFCFFNNLKLVFNSFCSDQKHSINFCYSNNIKFVWFFYQFFIRGFYLLKRGEFIEKESYFTKLVSSQLASRVRRLFKWINLFSNVFSKILENPNGSQKVISANSLSVGAPKTVRTTFLFILTIWIKLWRMNSYCHLYSIQTIFLFRSYHKYLLLRYRESNFKQLGYQYDRRVLYLDMIYQFYIQFWVRKQRPFSDEVLEANNINNEVSSQNLVSVKSVNKFNLVHELLIAKRKKSKHTKRFWRRLYYFISRRVYNYLFLSGKPVLYTFDNKTYVTHLLNKSENKERRHSSHKVLLANLCSNVLEIQDLNSGVFKRDIEWIPNKSGLTRDLNRFCNGQFLRLLKRRRFTFLKNNQIWRQHSDSYLTRKQESKRRFLINKHLHLSFNSLSGFFKFFFSGKKYSSRFNKKFVGPKKFGWSTC